MIRKQSSLNVDAGFVLVLSTVALVGFHATFSGPDYLFAGVAGLLLGTGLAVLSVRLGQPAIVLAVFTVATFFLVGGAAALHGLGGLSWLPLPSTLDRLATGSIDGWKDLLTTLPPVDNGVLLVIPYLMGLVGGAAGTALASRLRSPIGAAAVPVALMVGVILLGSQKPGEVLLSSAIFFGVLIWWMALRAHRTQIQQGGRSRVRQVAVATALVVATGGLGTMVGPHLPGVSTDSRYVLRSHVVPPFDIGQYPSPLASYRRYRPKFVSTAQSPGLANAVLFHVKGVPPGTFMRIATLDSYDGTVWAASNDPTSVDGLPDTFQRVGTTIGTSSSGPTTGPVTVTIQTPYVEPGVTTNVWLPTLGSVTSLVFSSRPAPQVADRLRYNLATGSAILPTALRAGDTYSFTAVKAAPVLAQPSMAAWSGAGAVSCPLDQCQGVATKLAGGSAGSKMQQIFNVAAELQKGVLTDGEGTMQIYTAGHSIARLDGFSRYADRQFAADGFVGDGEQYAAFMALMANELGVPARVVFGGVTDASGNVLGSAIEAWVEMRLADGTWADLQQSAFLGRNTKIPPLQTSETIPKTAQQVPAPLPLRPPASATSPTDDGASPVRRTRTSWWSSLVGAILWILTYLGIPVGVVLALCWLIVLAKRRRAHRRRTRGTPANRLAGAWHEYLDRALDHGHVAPTISTRREQAAALVLASSSALASAADNTMFGRSEPDDAIVESYWSEVEAAIGSLGGGRNRRQRILAMLNPISLIPRQVRARSRQTFASARVSTKERAS